jgi:hypothetical protein
LCHLGDEAQFGLLLCGRQWIAGLSRGEAALRTDRQPVQWDVLGRLTNARLHGLGMLQRALLGGEQAKHDGVLRQDIA